MKGLDRLNRLIDDIYLLDTIGEVITIQIDLLGVVIVSDALKDRFNDSEGEGLFIDNFIIQRRIAGEIPDHSTIFESITDITGDFESIETVTALIRVGLYNTFTEVTIEIDGMSNKLPNLLQVADNQLYFDLMHLIQTKWTFAKSQIVHSV